MHLYSLGELKAKTIRSWARAYGEELESGQNYTEQPPTITVAFTNGTIKPIQDKTNPKTTADKIHRVCMIMDCEDHTVFTDAMELHYIDMSAFAKAINEGDNIKIDSTEETMFAKWLSLITQKEIRDKGILEKLCEEEGALKMAIDALARQSEDKIIRQAYQRRQDEIYFYNKNMYELGEYKRKVEQAERKTEQAERKTEQAEAEIEKLRKQLAAFQAQ